MLEMIQATLKHLAQIQKLIGRDFIED